MFTTRARVALEGIPVSDEAKLTRYLEILITGGLVAHFAALRQVPSMVAQIVENVAKCEADLQASGLPEPLHVGVSGKVWTTRESPLGTRVSLVSTVARYRDGWRIMDASPVFAMLTHAPYVVNMTEERIAMIAHAGKPFDHFARQVRTNIYYQQEAQLDYQYSRMRWQAPAAWETAA
jgi:hypothetical protein